MRSCTLVLGIASLALLASCGGSSSHQTSCGRAGNSVSSRAGTYDFVLAISAATSTPPPVHLKGMAGASPTHVDLWVCPVGKKHAVATAPRATVIDRSSGTRAPLPLARHGSDHHAAANVNLPHHAAVELVYAGKTVTLIPPTD